ncbi:sad1 unc domain protein [Colletotrichum plurivorum]|uniref:Sad1 unc domain protein n=1 Tax=Colletotrichum plurivorum TaxID=2175906 RepID=A0A8H6K037_9PEZI|nr:sad1 unc domain protein [Colletotrichum plurivorum]
MAAGLLFSTSSLASSQPSILVPSAATQPSVCDFKTINYITHTLPQQCLRTSWPGDKGTDGASQPYDDAQPHVNGTSHGAGSNARYSREIVTETARSEASIPPPTDRSSETIASPRPFMSFEDWKEMMLRKAGQDPTELRNRKMYDTADRDQAMRSPALDSLGDDGEIDLNFDVVSEKISSIASAPQATQTEVATQENHQEPVLYDDGSTQYYRSKDAGKTCKERFSYSSFDAGATVLKTNKGAKNAKAILVENKDSYMLLECSSTNKFVIVELSDDILVDTVVLANFEFFSSMIRHFRVSVSDRYPVKADKWRDLGTFEAKNSRDIQPFLVPNPLIWAKYVRIEFLTHFGNEYYCPVSLLRVHGTRMLESLKDTEPPVDDDDAVDEPYGDLAGHLNQIDSIDSSQQEGPPPHASEVEASQVAKLDVSTNPFGTQNVFRSFGQENTTCSKSTTFTDAASFRSTSTIETSDVSHASPDHYVTAGRRGGAVPEGQASEGRSLSTSSAAPSHPEPNAAAFIPAVSVSATGHPVQEQTDSRTSGEETSATSSSTKANPQPNAQSRSKGNSTALPASPTVQESFFKAVSKRLQLLEANVTLSLKYIEDQSRFLQETQHMAERKQLSRIDVFLDSLNHTVLSELRSVRQQYDQIWQSTVIALESQREQSQRETVALSSRLNILADEVVFQKRMAIVQAILLLSCLVLVIFSRAMTQPILTGSFDLGRTPHPLPDLPSDRDHDSTRDSRYDQLGQPFDAADCGAVTPSSDAHRMPKANSDVGQGHYSHGHASPRAELVSTSRFLPDDQLLRKDTNTSFLSSYCPSTPSPDDETFATTAAAHRDRGYPVDPSENSVGILHDPPLIVEPDARFLSQARGLVSSTVRKPLPALPEYPT